MERDDTATAFDEPFERGLFAVGHEARVSLIDHEDVCMFKFGGAGRMQGTVNDGAVLRQSLAPIREKLGIVMQTGRVGLQPCANVYVHTIGILTRDPGRSLRTGRAS